MENFVKKFKLLWHSGYDAHLDVDTHAGKVWVGLRLNLGNHPDLPNIIRIFQIQSRNMINLDVIDQQIMVLLANEEGNVVDQ